MRLPDRSCGTFKRARFLLRRKVMPHQQEPDKNRKGNKARGQKKRPKENGQASEEKQQPRKETETPKG
jgi:hypothetical protein